MEKHNFADFRLKTHDFVSDFIGSGTYKFAESKNCIVTFT
jgi:hypothetical protein